ncbi:DUF2490 domain-containing protein [Flavobacteriaceae bacterium D16]|nr:DUF2490 domain-containing protein [Flavobacteriaceae bacterium D16]
MKKVFLGFLIIIFIPAQAISQQGIASETFEQTQFWTSINSTARISKHWGMIADVHLRRENFISDPNFYFLRLGAAYWLNDQISFVGGGAALWLATETDSGRKYALERRIYQQALWRALIGKITFLQRVRIEQRWHEVLNTDSGSVDRTRYSTRFRFLISAAVQVFEDPRLPRPVLSNEILFHAGKEIIYNTFDQNRLFLGFNQRLSKSLTIDYGYMMVYQQRYTGNQYDLNHTFRLFLYYSPDFRKRADDDLPHYPVGGIE